MARDLMTVLGYPRWNEFNKSIDRAKVACQNANNDPAAHFSGSTQKTKGRTKQDYKLSRYACYLVAMNGDPRKSEIAAAQSYFVAKTREAETVAPKQVDRIDRELELQKLKLEVAKAEKEAAIAKGNYEAWRHGLKISDPITYRVVCDGEPLAKALAPASEPVKPEIRTPESEPGISLTQLMGQLNCFDRTPSGGFKAGDRKMVKGLLKDLGIDLDTGKGTAKLEQVIANKGIPESRVADVATSIREEVQKQRPNIYASAIASSALRRVK